MYREDAGITLIEMIIVLAIIGLITAIAFPAVTSGLDSVRLSSASDSIVSFLNAGLNRAERRQTPVEIYISIAGKQDQDYCRDTVRELNMPETIHIVRIHPVLPTGRRRAGAEHRPVSQRRDPRFGVEIASPKGYSPHRARRSDHGCSAGGATVRMESSRSKRMRQQAGLRCSKCWSRPSFWLLLSRA